MSPLPRHVRVGERQLPMSQSQDQPRFGLLAGWGRYPIVVAQVLNQKGYQVYCLGIKGHADPILQDVCHDYREEGLARVGAHIRYFRAHGIRHATMAGKIHKSLIFKRHFLVTHRPDWRCVRMFFPHFITGSRDRRDDTLLKAIVDTYAKSGIVFAPATTFAPELLVRVGQLSGRTLSRTQQKDVDFGWRLAKEMGRLDIGQTVVVKGQAILAVEALEGTDACIRRAGSLCESGGFTVVKVAKPQQDMRFDVPTIGLGTLKTLADQGGRVLAVEGRKTIILDEPDVVEFADRHHIAIIALENDSSTGRRSAA